MTKTKVSDGPANPSKSGTWMDEITDSESEDVTHSQKLTRANSEEDLYLEIIKKDILCKDVKDVPSTSAEYVAEKKVITIEDKEFSEDEKVNQYLDDIERKLEEKVKKKDKDNWNVVNYFSDIICVKEIENHKKNLKKTIVNDIKRVPCKRRKAQNLPVGEDSSKRKRRCGRNVTLSEGEILSEEELILSDVSLSPERVSPSRHKRERRSEWHRKYSDRQRSHSRERSRKYPKWSKDRYKITNESFSSDQASPGQERRRRKKVTHESLHSKHLNHHKRSHHSYSDHRRYYSSPETHREVKRTRSNDKHKSKRHCKCETKPKSRSKSPSDYFDESKYHGSDKSRIRNLKKKYDEYLRHAKKCKNENQNSKHIEKFVELRSKLKGEDTAASTKDTLETGTSSIDYKKEEEKFLRSLETYLEIKKKQEQTMSTGVSVACSSNSNNKEYDPEMVSSEEEEYVPENFTPEDISTSHVEAYDPCNVTLASDASFTYEPTKIDEYEPIILKVDEEYCPMPVDKALNATYNPTTKVQSMPLSRQLGPGWSKPTPEYTSIPKQNFPMLRRRRSKMKLIMNKPAGKVVSKNTVFIGNIVNPLAVSSNKKNTVKRKSLAIASTNKSKIMSKLVHEKLLEIEKKKLKLLEEINRKKILKIQEKCDQVALRKLEKRKSDLMLKIYNSSAETDNHQKPSSMTTEIEDTVEQSTNNKNVPIKAERVDVLVNINRIHEKLSAFEKKKADLTMEIKRRLMMNSEKVQKERIELASKLEALEKTKSALLVQVNRKEAEQGNVASQNVLKKERDLEEAKSHNVTTTRESSVAPSISVDINIRNNNLAGDVKQKAPVISKKLVEIEQEKAKLLAQIEAKSNKAVQKENNKPRLKILKPEALDEKLGKLAKEKIKLLMEIEKKKMATETQTLTILQANPQITMKQEKNVDIPAPILNIKKEPKDVTGSRLSSSSLLTFKIKELEQQKAQLMKSLAKKLPVNKKIDLKTNEPQTSVSIKKPNPDTIVELASKVKLKVDQQLSEINKKKMELMKQINAKSLNTDKGTESSLVIASSTLETQNVKDKLLELEKNKLKLLMETREKLNEKKSNEENQDDKTQDTNISNALVTTSLPVIQDKTENVQPDEEMSQDQNEKSLCVSKNQDEFKIPDVPFKKNKRENVHRSEMRRTKRKKFRKLINMSRKKINMIKRFRETNALRSLGLKSEQSFETEQTQNVCSEKLVQSQSNNFSTVPSSDVIETSNTSSNIHTNSKKVETLINNKDEDSIPPETPKEIQDENVSDLDVEVLETPKPVIKSLEISESSNLSTVPVSDVIETSNTSSNIHTNSKNVETIINNEDEDNIEETNGQVPSVSRMMGLAEVLMQPNSNPRLLTYLKNSSLNCCGIVPPETKDENVSDLDVEVLETPKPVIKSLEISRSSNLSTVPFSDVIETSNTSSHIHTNSKNVETLINNEDEDSIPPETPKEIKDENVSVLDVLETHQPLEIVVLDEAHDMVADRNISPDEYITLKVIKVEKPSNSEDENEDNQFDGAGERSKDYSDGDTKETNDNNVNRDSEPCPKSGSGNSQLPCDNLRSELNSDEVVFIEETPPKGDRSDKLPNEHTLTSPSPLVSRVILNNKRKLIATNDACLKKNKHFSNSKSSVFRFVCPKKSPQSASLEFKQENHLKSSNSVFHLNRIRTRKRKLDRRLENTKEKLAQKKLTRNSSYLDAKFKSKLHSPLGANMNKAHKVRRHLKSSNKYKLSNVCPPSVISKFKLVHNQTNTKLSKYKTLPPSIRRHAMSRNTEDERCAKRAGRREKPKDKSSTYKVCRVRNENERQETSLRRAQHLVSKYKMVRISNQRERNKMNLSQRVMGAAHPNRTMKVIKLDGTSYNVSSRSLKRKVSANFDTLGTSRAKTFVTPCTSTRKLIKAQEPGSSIFSNRQIFGRCHLTSSRLRSLAVLTSRLRKNNMNATYSSNRQGGSGHTTAMSRNSKHDPKSKIYRNLCYKSSAEILKMRRSSRYRSRRKYSSRVSSYSDNETKYCPTLDSSPPKHYPNSDEAEPRYFASEDPRSTMDEECVETVIPRRRQVGALPGYIPF